MKLLLSIDGSPVSAAPVHAVVSRPWPSGSVIRVLTVVEIPLPVAPEVAITENLAEALKGLRKEAEARVQNVRGAVTKSGLPVETRIREGNAGPEIVQEANEWDADLILMGSHGRTGLKRILMGSVARYVVSHASCSVEVVREVKAENASPPEG